MIGRLVLRHEIIQNLAKPLLITVVTITLVLNILTFKMARNGGTSLLDGFGAVQAQFVFLLPVIMILLMGKAGARCRFWEAGLPLAARKLWWAHFLALASASLFLILVSGVTFAGFGALNAAFIGKTFFNLADVLRLMVRPVAVSLTAAGLVAVWRPGMGRLAEEPGWSRHRALVIMISVGLLGLLVMVPSVFLVVPLVLTGLVAVRVNRILPLAMSMSGSETRGAAAASAAAEKWEAVGPSRRVVVLMLLRTLLKWPVSWLAMVPLAALFGLMMSSRDILGMDEPYLRFMNFFMAVYILFALTGHFVKNLHKVDHLPVDRRTLLRWLVVPITGFFLLGYASGRIMDTVDPISNEKIVFDNGGESYGLKVSPEYFAFAGSDETPVMTAPWGEAHEAPVEPVFRGLPGVLWKPYATPEGSSLEFVAWQISRAAAAVYGLEIDPDEISARYLKADPDGRVTVRESGLTLAADFPDARPGSSGPVFPVLVGGEMFLLMVILTLYFKVFKPGITIRKTQVVFWVIMGGLMACHIGGYIFFMLGWTREWVVYGFWLGRIRELGELGPAGYMGAWVGMLLLVSVAWRWAERSFLAAEAPTS